MPNISPNTSCMTGDGELRLEELADGCSQHVLEAHSEPKQNHNSELSQHNVIGSACVCVGTLLGVKNNATPLVEISKTSSPPQWGRTVVPLTEDLIGCDVLLAFESGNQHAPIVIGVVQKPCDDSQNTTVDLDGDKLVLSAKKAITLQCGKAMIELSENGKITLKGTYILSRSSGANCIKGGSVQLN